VQASGWRAQKPRISPTVAEAAEMASEALTSLLDGLRGAAPVGNSTSTTPSQNTVTFYNGKNVTPTAPTTIATITVPVPTGATTGPIKVTVGTNSATSPENFKVTAN